MEVCRAVEEVAAYVRARTLGSNHDHVHILGRIDAGDLAILASETVREVKHLTRSHVLLDLLPHLACSIPLFCLDRKSCNIMNIPTGLSGYVSIRGFGWSG